MNATKNLNGGNTVEKYSQDTNLGKFFDDLNDLINSINENSEKTQVIDTFYKVIEIMHALQKKETDQEKYKQSILSKAGRIVEYIVNLLGVREVVKSLIEKVENEVQRRAQMVLITYMETTKERLLEDENFKNKITELENIFLKFLLNSVITGKISMSGFNQEVKSFLQGVALGKNEQFLTKYIFTMNYALEEFTGNSTHTIGREA